MARPPKPLAVRTWKGGFTSKPMRRVRFGIGGIRFAKYQSAKPPKIPAAIRRELARLDRWKIESTGYYSSRQTVRDFTFRKLALIPASERVYTMEREANCLLPGYLRVYFTDP